LEIRREKKTPEKVTKQAANSIREILEKVPKMNLAVENLVRGL